MMKIIALLNDQVELDKIVTYADYVMAGNTLISPDSSHSFSLAELFEIADKVNKSGKSFVLALDLMLIEGNFDIVYQYINAFKNNAYFYVTDLGVLEILKEENLNSKTIYDPRTLITNYLDFNAYSDDNLLAIGVSLEITLDDVMLINEKKESPIFYKGFGYPLMLHSRRKLISLYQEAMNNHFEIDNLTITEETREARMPIVQNELGTLIYRSYAVSVIKEFPRIKALDYVYLDHNFISNEKYLAVLKLYSELNQNKLTVNEATEIYKNLGIETEDGFFYQDTVYVKEPSLR